MDISSVRTSKITGGAALLAVGMWLGTVATENQVARAVPTDASPFANLAIFARALAHIDMSYVEPVDQEKLVYGAIRGMVGALDPHSSFLDPEEYRILTSDTEGRFAGIGVEIAVRERWLTVLAVFDGSPAQRVGLRPGDRFVAIEGHDTQEISISDAVRLMRGEPGTTVNIRIRREFEDKDIELTLTREFIRVPSVAARVLPDRTVLLEVRSFQEQTVGEMKEALDQAEAASRRAGGVAGLLIDLRNNPGGLLHQAVDMSDEFLSSGVIVSTRGRDGKVLQESRAHRRGTQPSWPIVLLVNGYTASAAEIVAGALRDHQRAVIVGERTFGKGSVQNVIELEDGSAMKLTIARYFTPRGTSIQAQGITPDVEVKQPREEDAPETDDQIREESLEGHLAEGEEKDRATAQPLVGRNEARSAPRKRPEDERPFRNDFQAQIAHQTLRGLIAQKN